MSEGKKIEQDLDAIRALANVLEETGLTEIEVERGELRLRISRGATAAAYTAHAPAPAIPAAPSAGQPAASPEPAPADAPGAVKSPMVGTAYLSPSPGSPPFVNIGKTVAQGQTVMIVEAMKTMNEIKAPMGGTVKDILARDAEPVEFDEVLLIIE